MKSCTFEQVYALALYVEVEKAARELGIRDRGGFFKDAPDEDFCTAIIDGAFDKLLQVQLVRTIEGSQFYEACFSHPFSHYLFKISQKAGLFDSVAVSKAFYCASQIIKILASLVQLWL